jgi:MinD-like ATPase involved in chromosome partitioning or flagellar assembly
MLAMLNSSKLLSMTIGNMVTTEEDQSEVISNLIQSLTNTYKICLQYNVAFTTTDGLINAWHSGLSWSQKREAKPTASSDDVLNLFDHE